VVEYFYFSGKLYLKLVNRSVVLRSKIKG